MQESKFCLQFYILLDNQLFLLFTGVLFLKKSWVHLLLHLFCCAKVFIHTCCLGFYLDFLQRINNHNPWHKFELCVQLNVSFYNTNNIKIRVKFILPSNFSNTELWSVNHILTFENSDLKASKKINADGEILKEIKNALLGVNVYKTLRPCWHILLTRFLWNITTTVISSWGIFSPFLPLIISL